MTQIIIFNSPPNAGKDTAALVLQQYLGASEVNLCSFKKPLIELALKVSGLSEIQWNEIYTRELKEQKDYRLRIRDIAVSPRQYLIWLSETVIKPVFGKGFFGEQAAKQVEEGKINVFSDGGFMEELEALIDTTIQMDSCNQHPDVTVVRIEREGCSFKNDSRGYLGAGYYDVKFIDLENDTIEQFAKDITLIAQTL